jgi:hypothetical protein
MIDLISFCQTDGSKAINTPWSEGDYTYASNGHLLVRVPRREDVAEKIEAPNIAGTSLGAGLDKTPAEWVDVPRLVVAPDDCPECKGTGKQYNCPECEGEGEVHLSTDWSDYGEETCETCGGNGQLSKDQWLRLMPKGSNPAGENCYSCNGIGKKYEGKAVEVGKGLFTDTLLAQISILPKCKIGVVDKLSPAIFRFEGGDGLLMPRLSD